MRPYSCAKGAQDAAGGEEFQRYHHLLAIPVFLFKASGLINSVATLGGRSRRKTSCALASMAAITVIRASRCSAAVVRSPEAPSDAGRRWQPEPTSGMGKCWPRSPRYCVARPGGSERPREPHTCRKFQAAKTLDVRAISLRNCALVVGSGSSVLRAVVVRPARRPQGCGGSLSSYVLASVLSSLLSKPHQNKYTMGGI